MSDGLKVVPLGGLGRVGGNLMVYETGEDLIVVDCGVSFPGVLEPGVDWIVPDTAYLRERRDKLRAYVITHGHEDHIGALPFVLPDFPAPVYATAFTLAMIRMRLSEHPHLDAQLVTMRDGERFTVGAFDIQPIAVTHSIPGAVSLGIRTPAGIVVHTGDFKFEEDPLDGRVTDFAAYESLGKEGVLALLSDSTNAERPGRTWSERSIAVELERLIAEAPQRVLVTTFASNLFRVQSIVEAAVAADRRVVTIGRSMRQNVQVALEMGLLTIPRGTLVEPDQYERVPAGRTVVLASGCQGEPFSSVARIAAGQHGQIKLDPGDWAILSARRIPGNERAVSTVVNNFARLGVRVIDDRAARVHTSGHAFSDEQRQMLAMCRPRFFIPVHGEYRHMSRHLELAREMGVPADRTLLLEDGHPVGFTANGAADGGAAAMRLEPVESGDIYIDGTASEAVAPIVLRDRRILSESGFVACVVILDDSGNLTRRPELMTRGVIHIDGHPDLIEGVVEAVTTTIEKLDPGTAAEARLEAVRLTLRRYFKRELGRRPLLLPVVLAAPVD